MNPIFDGLKLMAAGMGFVFSFLVIMIICMKIMAKLLKPIETCLDPAAPAPKARANSGDDNARRAAAAIAALIAHKNGK